jgi:hypothetical protein
MGYFSDNLPGQDGGISTTPEPIELNQNLEETSGESEETSNTGTNDPLSALKNNLVENSLVPMREIHKLLRKLRSNNQTLKPAAMGLANLLQEAFKFLVLFYQRIYKKH